METLKDSNQSRRMPVTEVDKDFEARKLFALTHGSVVALPMGGLIVSSYVEKAREFGSYSALNKAIYNYVNNLPAIDPRCYTFSLDDKVE